jgi:hypothetical protein
MGAAHAATLQADTNAAWWNAGQWHFGEFGPAWPGEYDGVHDAPRLPVSYSHWDE